MATPCRAANVIRLRQGFDVTSRTGVSRRRQGYAVADDLALGRCFSRGAPARSWALRQACLVTRSAGRADGDLPAQQAGRRPDLRFHLVEQVQPNRVRESTKNSMSLRLLVSTRSVFIGRHCSRNNNDWDEWQPGKE